METKKILLDSAAKMSYVEKVDSYLHSLKIGKSPMVDSWFMMSSPVPIMSAVVAYILFIRIGPRLMKNRPPLKMNKLIAYYNAIQVLLAATICVKVFKLNLFRDGIVYAGCRYPSNTQNPMLLDVGWWYFFAKFTELLDTVFFVLRKKDKQVTFLHVYHHVVMALYSWSYLKFAAGGEGAILALLNSMVHVVMYTYYLMSGLGPRFQKYLWWKKYVTKMQLTQFIMMLVYCSITHFSPRCQYASGFTYFISGNVIIFLILFLNFYSKSYYKKKLAEKELKAGYELSCKMKENGNCNGSTGHDNKDVCENTNDTAKANGDDIALKMGEICGHYINDDNVQNITKRKPKSSYETNYSNGPKSIIKK